MNDIKNQSSALTQQINYWIRFPEFICQKNFKIMISYFFGEEIDFARRFI
jgi:hypothetical protein